MHTTHSLDWKVSMGAGGALGRSLAIGAEGVASETLAAGASMLLSRVASIFWRMYALWIPSWRSEKIVIKIRRSSRVRTYAFLLVVPQRAVYRSCTLVASSWHLSWRRWVHIRPRQPWKAIPWVPVRFDFQPPAIPGEEEERENCSRKKITLNCYIPTFSTKLVLLKWAL